MWVWFLPGPFPPIANRHKTTHAKNILYPSVHYEPALCPRCFSRRCPFSCGTLLINELTTATVPGFFDDDGESSPPWGLSCSNSGCSNPPSIWRISPYSLEGRSASWTLPEETLAARRDRKLIFLSGKDRVPV